MFVNPSVSEVLCTTVAEALAMGKWVVIPSHPSNDFFMQFPNCLLYSTGDEFAAAMHWALHNDPPSLLTEVQTPTYVCNYDFFFSTHTPM